MRLQRKHLLITGATGFVGTALIKRFLQDNVKLTAAVMAGEETGHLPEQVARIVVPPLSESSDYRFALQDVNCVVHLAARVHVMQDSATDPLHEFRVVNLHGTEQMARQAARAGVKRFVFISTVKVHGEETAKPYDENSPLDPGDPYGVSKAEAEAALWRVSGETGLEIVIVRPPLVYGPGVKANFRQLMNIVSRKIPLPFASIRNRRSFVFVENLVDALACCANHPGAAGQAYLVSDGEDISTPDLIKKLAAALGIPAYLLPFPPTLMSVAGKITGRSSLVERITGSLQVNSSKIRTELGWIPPFTLEQGLVKTAEWFNARK